MLLEHVRTDLQCADVFTKDLQPMKWPHTLELIGIDDTQFTGGEPWPQPEYEPEDTEVSADDPQKPYDHFPLKGAHTAADIVDDSVESALTTEDVTDELVEGLQRLKVSCANVIRTTVALGAGHTPSSSSTYGASSRCRLRKSSKLPGWGIVYEIHADDDSNLGIAAADYKGVRVIRNCMIMYFRASSKHGS